MIFNGDIISLIIFGIILGIFLYIKRKNLETHSIAFPLLYMCMYRTNIGLKLMDKVSSRFKELIKFTSMCFIGVAFAGLVFISFSILLQIYQYFFARTIVDAGFRLVLPGSSIPGIGYLTFWHWIISIFILAGVHEFGHGVVARAYDIKVKSSGFAFLGIIFPIIPAAFVEPDEKELSKKSDIAQYSVFAAGPIVNIVLALLIALVFTSAVTGGSNPYEDKITEQTGFSVSVAGEEYPAAKAGIINGTLITNVNGISIKNSSLIAETLDCQVPGYTIILGNENQTYNITTAENPIDKSAYMGIFIKNEKQIKPGYEIESKIYFWFKGLFRWLFLLNLLIGLANLLPIFITDGARMLQTFLQKMIPNNKKAMKIWYAINMTFALLLIIGILSTYLGGLF